VARMKVYVFPADMTGCGYYRLIWPAETLIAKGHDITIVPPHKRDNMMQATLRDGVVTSVKIPSDADVIVLQRVTHRYLAQAIKLMRLSGVAVVVDMDDDLTCIHPSNPAFNALHPVNGNVDHNWQNTLAACDNATMVTVSTPALVNRYGKRTPAHVLYNMVPERMLALPRVDSDVVGWAGAVFSHPTDLQELGPSIAALLRDGGAFKSVGPIDGVHKAFGLASDTPVASTGIITDILEWPEAVSSIGIGLAPLTDSRFNNAKSWLKMAEYAAVGVPCIASPREEYRRLHRKGVGLLAKNPTEWTKVIRKLRGSENLREDLSWQGRAVMETLTIEDNAELWAEAWTEALIRERASRNPLVRSGI
jgi:hypothetical protein